MARKEPILFEDPYNQDVASREEELEEEENAAIRPEYEAIPPENVASSGLVKLKKSLEDLCKQMNDMFDCMDTVVNAKFDEMDTTVTDVEAYVNVAMNQETNFDWQWQDKSRDSMNEQGTYKEGGEKGGAGEAEEVVVGCRN